MAKPVSEMTPMQRQYHDIKERNQDCILFFRLGDFYEMFDEDAKLAARPSASMIAPTFKIDTTNMIRKRLSLWQSL